MRYAAALVMALITSGTIAAAGSAGVSERQQAMKDMAASAKTIDSMFKGQTPYDQRALKNAADTIVRHSGEALVAQFPTVSLGAPSEARPEIARKPGEFAALAGHLQEFARALSAAADEAPAQITPSMRMGAGAQGAVSLLGRRARVNDDPQSIPAEHVFHMILQDCTSCHALYREKP
jgi:cytochrome c556